jgi:hypothetical protein
MSTARVPPARLRRLAAEIHKLGPFALFCALREIHEGADLHDVLERFAAVAPLAGFVHALGGAEMPGPRIIKGGRS